ncbi:MAG: hypothetical protein DRJ67_09305 [Thermoprotei archaeon]|nr:MAG: hypothetical protein DRJ67_09305 [Thermoprotei archaeon]
MSLPFVGYTVNWGVVEEVANHLRRRAVRRLIDIAESVDPQMAAVSEILSKYSRLEDSVFYVVSVATVSYMLTARGEEHWRLAASYSSGNPLSDLRGFVAESPSLRLGRRARLARVERLASFYPRFLEEFNDYLRDLEALRRDLARVLRADPDSKTIVFAIKMLYYAAKAAGLEVRLPPSIPVPVDRRLCLLSLVSGVIEGGTAEPREARRLLSRAPHLVREAWSVAGRRGDVPPLRLDALLWLLGGCYERGGRDGALRLVLELFPELPRGAEPFIRLLLGLRP